MSLQLPLSSFLSLPSLPPTGPVYQLSAQAVCPALSGPSSGHRGDFPKRFAGSSGHIQVQSLKRLCSAPRSPGTDPPVPVPYMLCGDPVDPLTWALLKSLQISIPKKTEDTGFFLGRRVSLRSQHTHPHFGKAPLRDRHALALEIAEARKPFSPKLSLP